MTTHLPGHTTDTLVHYWNGWWAGRALGSFQSPFYTPYLYHPAGLSLVYHNFAWVSIAGWLVLRPWVGGYAAYNLLVLANMALCGFATFLLARDLVEDRRAAFAAGLIYQCWPFRLSQLDHPNLISTQWIPIFLLFLIRAVRRGRWRDGALAGLFLALVGYTRWQQLIPAAIVGGTYLACTLPGKLAISLSSSSSSSSSLWRRWLPALLLTGGVAIAALTPPALLLMEQQRTAPADVIAEDETLYQTDLLAYVTPSGAHPLLGSLTQLAYDRYYARRHRDRRYPAYVGATTLILALWGLWKARRDSVPWAAAALVLVLLALGPTLLVNGTRYPAVPMPYRLVARLVLVRLMRVPDRFNLFLALPVALLAAHGASHALTIAGRRDGRTAVALSCLLSGLILFEYLAVPVPLQQPQVSPFYTQLATEEGDFAVLNLPRDTQESKGYMFAQVTHDHPILQGKTARFPQGAFDYLDGQPWLRALRQSSRMPPARTDVSRQLATLAQDGVRYVILHKTRGIDVRLDHWRRYFAVPPRYEDAFIAVYPTAPLAGRDLVLTDELAPGIGPIRVITSTDCVNPGRLLEVDVVWGTTAPPGRNLDARLALATEDGTMRYEQVFPLSPGWRVQKWPVNAVAWGYYTLRVPPSLHGGVYAITLTLVDPATGAAQGRAMQVGQVTVSEGTCTFPVPAGAVEVNALFGDDLRLLGYQQAREGDQLALTLHWRSERRMESDYMVFVHVFDPVSGLRAAQDDSMPLRWTYPTTFWEPGEVVRDEIPLSLEEAPAGVYGIVVGVYDPTTMERLLVIDGTGRLQPDAQVLLPGGTVEVR
jgi:hypothetical protein